MTEEEMKGTQEYQLGRKLVNDVWKEDKDSLRGNVETYQQTFQLVQAIWSAYKRSIPLMTTKEFWDYPEGLAQAAFDSGLLKGSANQLDCLWVIEVDHEVDKSSPGYGTVAKLLLRFFELDNKLWESKYCKLITGTSFHDI